MADYRFRPLERGDKGMFCDWLSRPHIGGWWQDGDSEWALLEQDWTLPCLDMRIVELDGVPFAFVQDYPVHHWTMPQYAALPDDARAIDTFLGDPAYLGKGHGSGYLRQRAAQLTARGASLVAVDPDPENTRAIAAYRRAGFTGDLICQGEDGDPVQVLTFSPSLC